MGCQMSFDDNGYELDDPKSPGWVDRMTAPIDDRETPEQYFNRHGIDWPGIVHELEGTEPCT